MDAIVYDKVGKEAKKIRDALYGIYPQETITDAAIASFDDGADGIPVEKLVANIEPVQDLHGYDHPWPAGSTANLLQATPYGGAYGQAVGFDLKTSEAMEYSFSSDLSTINIVSNPAWRGRLFATAPLDAGTYTTYNWTLTQNGRVSIYVTDGDLVVVSNVANQSAQGPQANRDITVSQGQRIAVFVGGAEATTVSITYFMVCASTGTVSYVPFENICPISGHTEAKISDAAVNIWDEEWESGSYDTSGNPIAGADRIRTKNAIPVKPGVSYYLHSDSILGVCWYDKDGVFISGQAITNVVAIAPNNAHYLKFSVAQTTTYGNNISINYPATDTEYHPYTGSQISVTFPETIYGGKDDITAGSADSTRYLHTYSGVGGLSYNGTKALSSRFSIPVGVNVIWRGTEISNMFRPDWNVMGHNDSTPPYIFAVYNNNIYFTLPAEINTVEGGREWLNEHVPQFLLYRAEPQTLLHDPQTLDTLYGTNNIWADTGNIEKLTYRADLGKYIDSHITTAVANALNA